MFDDLDRKFMTRALQLAQNAEGRTSPNPLVGCVIVKNNQLIGEGFHHQAGTPHAEINALRSCSDAPEGATAYVTLEPCSHYGRTPPCTEALISSGIKRVVLAMVDPNPVVSGNGIRRLREGGIEVEVGLFEKEARKLNEPFIKAITTKMPFVTYKAALTLDGKIATNSGDSQWISNQESREYSHKLRNRYDLIMVGSDTVIDDNPMLTCRIPGGRDPVRVVVDGKLKIPLDAKVLKSSSTAPCIIATTLAASPEKLEKLQGMPNVQVIQYPTERYVPLRQLLRDLNAQGYNGLLLEGGSRLAGQMMAEGLIDKVEFFIAPKLIGAGLSPFNDWYIDKMSMAQMIHDWHVSLETGDIHVSGYLKPNF